MNPETFVDPQLPRADLLVLNNLLGDIESRTGSRDVSKQIPHQNGTKVGTASVDTANGDVSKTQNGKTKEKLGTY
jgi:hypothetical protein